MDTVDAFLRLHHAAGNAGWLREALRPSEPRAPEGPDDAGWTPERLLAAPVADWLVAGAPIGAREAAFGPEADAYVLEVLERIAGQLDGFRQTVENGIRVLLPEPERQATGVTGASGVEPQVVGDPAPAGGREAEPR